MLLRNLRYGLRQLAKDPGFAAVAILTSALGICLTATMFTVVYAVLFRPLPFGNPDHIVSIGQSNGLENHPGTSSLPNIRDWKEQSQTLEDLAYWELSVHNAESRGQIESVVDIGCSANLFSLLDVRPKIGRTFYPDEVKQAGSSSAVLSASVWRKLFSSDPNVVNSNLQIGRDTYTVIGVMQDDFIFPLTQDSLVVWVPLALKKDWEDRNTAMLQVIGRLKNGASAAATQTELTTFTSRLENGGGDTRVLVENYRESLTSDVRTALLSLEAAVLAVWLIACINVVGLLLARATGRRREIAIRSALGANRGHLLGQFFAESAVLAGAAGLVGLLLAVAATRVIRVYLESKLPFANTIDVSPPVIGVILLLSVLSTLLFGVWPALQTYWTFPQDALREGSAGAGVSRNQRRVRDILVVCEVALSLVLLLNAGLLLRTVYNLRSTSLGFTADHLIVGQLPLFQANYSGKDVIKTVYEPMIENLLQLPGVQSAAVANILPLNPNSTSKIPVQIQGRANPSKQKSTAELRIVSLDFYRTMGIRVVSGRPFDETDSRRSPWVLVVNKAFARKYFPDEDPIGRQIRTDDSGPHKYSSIVGVVEDTRQKSLADPVEPEMHICWAQLSPEDDLASVLGLFVQVAVRTQSEPASAITSVRSVLQQINPDVSLNVSTMREVLDRSLSSQTLVARLILIFAAAALLIAIIGLYGLLAYNVNRSMRDIAVRMAFGASRSDVLVLVIRHAAIVLGIGIVIGLVVWEETASLLRSYLYGLGSHDIATIVIVTALLAGCGLLASYIPARRASLVDPGKFLRHE